MLQGPLVFNGNENADLPVIYGTSLCRSHKIDYKHWAETVASLPECQQYGATYELSWFGIMPNDGKDDSHGINNLLAMHYYGTGPDGGSLQLNFQAGTYELDSPIIIKYMNNVTLNGKLGYGGYSPSEHTKLVKSEKFVPLWDKQLGAMVSIFGSRETTIQNISFEGVTESLTDINVKDHGITNVNSCLTQIKDSNFSNFGYSAISDFSNDEDMIGKPCNGPGISTLIARNKFNNVCNVSTGSDWLSTYGLRIENNQFENLKCGLQLHSPRVIAKTVMPNDPLLTVRNNTISGPGADFSGYAVGISVSGYDNVLIEGNVVKNGPDFGIAVWAYQNDYTQHDFDWGNINILNNELDNNKSGILLFNQAKPSGFQPTLSNARIENNKILSSWNSMVGPHIHIIGSAFNNVSISNNEMYGGLHGVWTPAGEYGIFEHNFFQPSNTFNLASYQFIGPQLLSDPSVNNSNHWWVPKTEIFSDNAMKIVEPYAPLKNGQHDQAWSVVKAPVETGKRYLFHVDMKTLGTGAAKGAVMVQFRKADGSFHSNSNSGMYYNGEIGLYEPVGVSFVVPEGAATVKVGVYVYENEHSSSVYFDNFSLVEVAP